MSSMQKRENISFLLLTFLLSWTSWGILVLLGVPATENVLSLSLYLLGGLSPTIVALVLPLFYGRAERNTHYKRYFNFKTKVRFYLLAISIPVILALIPYGAMFIFDEKAAASLNFQPFYMILPLFLGLIFGGGLEELGWRGILIHNLQKFNPALLSLVVGLVWTVWHTPLFFVVGVDQDQLAFLPFLITTLAYSLVLTPLYMKSGSVIPCIVFHALCNAFSNLGFSYGNDLFSAYMIDSLIKLGIGVIAFIVINSKILKATEKMESAT